MKHSLLPLTISYIAAVSIVLYPMIASVYNALIQSSLVAEYDDAVSQTTSEEVLQMLSDAQAWNAQLYTYVDERYFPAGLTETEIYESLLCVGDDGMMGYVSIPKIDVELPIYHGTDDETLQKGSGHLEASALPVGGESTHCVITAHRGLPTAVMFTHLDEMEIGDAFYLKVLGASLAYEVIEIREVEPEETQSLAAVEGEDLCTLVTCTPYGINSKRLLVTGQRTEASEEAEEEEKDEGTGAVLQALRSNGMLAAAAGAETLVYLILLFHRRRQQF